MERYMPYFMAGTIFYFAQMCLQNVFVALDQAAISIFLACLRKVILLIPLCFLLPYEFGVAGVYYSEGIADVTAGIITATTFYAMLPRILKKRENKLAAQSAAEKESEDTSSCRLYLRTGLSPLGYLFLTVPSEPFPQPREYPPAVIRVQPLSSLSIDAPNR